ncbi:ribonuclease HI [Actinomyces graevenitzii F0530]|uniref:Ribonuclease H n=1 Tax=Actinomyces graevenitzii F0530 TaxID=1321817 RepID=U1RCR7_9ACTO|nr:ribonuclease H [Actinomyces graevenitzii]ERH17443.1 ribonuclease HI [Actinomyces graevenitzii F0530]
MTTVVAIDGSALGNPGPAGWAWYVDENCWAAGGWPNSSNNRGELTALLELLKATAPTNEELHVLADSQYVINSVTKWMSGWKKRGWRKSDKSPVLNADLMQAIDEAISGRKVSFEWVRGHSGHPLNEAADDKARAAATAYQRHGSVESGPGWTRGENKGTTTTAPGSAQGSTALPGSAQGANFPSRAEAAMTPGLPRTAAHASSRVGTSTSQPQQNVTALQQQIAQTQREIASEQQKIVTAHQSIAAIQQNITAAQQKIAKIQQRIASAQQKIVSAQQEILSANRHGGRAKSADPNPDTLF